MFPEGFRPAGAEAHKNMLAFMRAALGEAHGGLVSYLDRMRRKRHQAVYDQVGVISDAEATAPLARAEELVEMVRSKLGAPL
jgi:hypothetical protein